jgi:hypothetical protein
MRRTSVEKEEGKRQERGWRMGFLYPEELGKTLDAVGERRRKNKKSKCEESVD